MEGTDDCDKDVCPDIGPVDGSDNGGDVSMRQLDDGDEVTSMATPTLDERDGMSVPVNTNGEDLGDLALTIPLHQARVVVEEKEIVLEDDRRREGEDDTGARGGFSPVSNVSLEIVEGHSPSLPHMENEKDNFSSFSDTSAVAVASERKELEDGEIDVGGSNSKGKSREQPSKKLTSPAAASSIRRRSRSGEGRRLDLPRYDVRYIIDRKRRDRNRRRSSSLESIGSDDRRRRGRSRSRSRGRRQRSSPSTSDTSPSLPSSPAPLFERKKGTPRSRSRRRRSSRISNSPDSNRGPRHAGGRRRSITPLSRRRKRSTFVESEANKQVSRRSPPASRKAKGQKRIATRSKSHDSDIVILPKKKSNKMLRAGESTAKKTGKRGKVATSNAGGAGSSKPKKVKKKAAVVANKRLDVKAAAAAAAAASSSSSAVAGKEVYAAGNKILVSVNFKHSTTTGKKSSSKTKSGPSNDRGDGCENMSPQHKPDSTSSAAVERAKAKKPSLVIDIMSSPYQVIDSSPKETIDIFSDDESAGGNMLSTHRRKKDGAAAVMTLVDERSSWSVSGSLNVPTVGQQSSSITDPEETAPSVTSTTHAPASTVTSTSGSIFPAVPSSLASATMTSGVAGGNEMSILSSPAPLRQNDGGFTLNSVIICTKSTAASGGVDASSTTNTFHRGPMTPPGDEHETLDLAQGPQTPSSDMAPDSYDPFNPTTDSPENRINQNTQLKKPPLTFTNEDSGAKTHNGIRNSDMSLSVDMEVDSPCSPGGSDLSDFFEPPKTPKRNKNSKRGKTMAVQKTRSKSTVQMKLIDDKLKIIDDVPTSAVEMAVKEKFLKKVQRQERIVEEIKMVLKPFYNKKKISKSSYKEIMRKCVPKVKLFCLQKSSDYFKVSKKSSLIKM